ncbi:SDR family oxidoreductase [Rhodoplanes sp. SY1]|uniref:SDR family oxidoreductase n=1 Tax=Rhodoplanes sp. SY1 TaxID=3166646 RepID=UPI0038B6678C
MRRFVAASRPTRMRSRPARPEPLARLDLSQHRVESGFDLPRDRPRVVGARDGPVVRHLNIAAASRAALGERARSVRREAKERIARDDRPGPAGHEQLRPTLTDDVGAAELDRPTAGATRRGSSAASRRAHADRTGAAHGTRDRALDLRPDARREHALDSISELTTELLDWTLKTNIYAMFWITKAAIPHLSAGSAIINTTSVVAYQPPKNLLDYAATKGAIMVFTKSLAKQLADKGIRVNGVAPGPVWTPLQVTGGQPPDRIPQFGATTPMQRPGQPAELAGLYVLLASAESSYSTGQIFGAVGGEGGP